ncbi:MAG: SpoIIE family protein phosphatase [Candidatus Coproplasma sp.]
MPVKINLKSVLLYAAYTVALLCINCAVKGAPFSLGLCFAMLICGTNIIVTPALYIICSAICVNWITSLLAIFEGGFLCAVTFIYRRAHKKIRAESAAYLCIALAPFVAFSPWSGIESLYFTDNAYVIKAVAAIAVIVFTFFCFKSVYSLLYRLYRCKLRADEIVCLAVTYTVFGIGLYNLVGLHASLAIGAGATVLAVRLFKSPAAVIIGCIIGLPCAVAELSINYITAFVILSILALLFAGAGRGAPSAVAIILGAAYFYVTGAFAANAGIAVVRGLLLFCCCMLPVLPTDTALEEKLNAMQVKKLLPTTGEQRFRYETGEKLFKTSEVFREIECAFNNLDEALDDSALRGRMMEELKIRLCANCERKTKCAKTTVYAGFKRLLDSGCMKGKVSLVDLPQDVTVYCAHPADVIEQMNKLLSDYRRLTVEAENARNGRRLLANQAKGIAEVLKSAAVEVSRGRSDHSRLEKRIKEALAANGVSCPELRVQGEVNLEIMATVVGKVKISAMREIIYAATGAKFILKDKIVYDADKSCYIFTVPPCYDAAFGVAFAVKDGEKVSGDTHSVININEHSFLMALCDGMGSGEYARKVSSTTISLIEAFYRAEMPVPTVLETINKLMCFNRDERFTCIDVAAIDLNTLKASFIKIGSPAGIIVRQGEIKVLESSSLPLGILDSIHPTVCEETLKCGDLVVFMSDGITSAFPSATDLYSFLENLKPLNPQSLAEKILFGAKEHTGGAPDDMTVLCVRIFERQTD